MDTFDLVFALILIGSIILEAILDARDHHGHFEKKDSLVNLKIASIGTVVNFAAKGTLFSMFLWIEPYAFFDAGSGILAWLAVFILTDLQYFLFHWLSHKSRFFWAMHVVHHSSHKFNYTTAIRTPFTNSFFRFATLTPLVLIGFDPLMVILMNGMIGTFTFFQHTEMVGKLGWLEYIFITPSHHRVHHASNEQYLDRNYGGVLVIWDKLFRTFEWEEEKPVYGLTKPLKDTGIYNVITHEWKDIVRDVKSTSNWKHKLQYVFGRPGWTPTAVRERSRVEHTAFSKISVSAIVTMLVLMGLSVTLAQTSAELVNLGIAAETKVGEQTALKYYERAIQQDPLHAEALWRASRMLSNQSGRSTDKDIKLQKANQANALAIRAIQIDPKSKDARLCNIIVLGLLSEAASSPAEKLSNAKVIYAEAETILKLDSLYAPAYYILGKWHLELAKLNWAEKLACNLLFGGVPKGVSFEKSIRYFEKAIQLQPNYILFYYGKASALYHMGRYDKVISLLELALQLVPGEPDDKLRQMKCRKLLDDSKLIIAKA